MSEKITSIKPNDKKNISSIFKEVVDYKDLLIVLVRRTFISQYKQTILGPSWAIVQPLLTSIVLNFVFGDIAGLTPNGIPGFLFYFSGSMIWDYFSSSILSVSRVYLDNLNLISKVYFPRIVLPISVVLTQLIPFAIQYVFFSAIYIIYLFLGYDLNPSIGIFITPVIVLEISILSLGIGLIISSLTTKYRDLQMVVSFGIQMLMYLSPVAYDISSIPSNFRILYYMNPITPILNTFRTIYFQIPEINMFDLGYSIIVTIIILYIGLISYRKVDANLVDTL